MTKFGKSGKTELSNFIFWIIWFRRFSEQEQDMSYNRRFEDPRCFEGWKRTKKHQGAKMEEIKPKAEVTKTRLFDFGYRSIRFFLNR